MAALAERALASTTAGASDGAKKKPREQIYIHYKTHVLRMSKNYIHCFLFLIKHKAIQKKFIFSLTYTDLLY